jgi:hypothetical protein
VPAQAAQPQAAAWGKCAFPAGSEGEWTPAPSEGPPVTPRSRSGTAPRSRSGGLELGQARYQCGMVPARPPVSARRRPRCHFSGSGVTPVQPRSRPTADPGHAPAKPGHTPVALNRGSGGARCSPGTNPGAFAGGPVHVRCTSGPHEPRLRPRSRPGATPVTPRRGPRSRPGEVRRGPVRSGLSPVSLRRRPVISGTVRRGASA